MSAIATSLYVLVDYNQRLQTLFQQNNFNVSFRAEVRLIAGNPMHILSLDKRGVSTIIDLCWGRHGVLLNSKRHIDRRGVGGQYD